MKRYFLNFCYVVFLIYGFGCLIGCLGVNPKIKNVNFYFIDYQCNSAGFAFNNCFFKTLKIGRVDIPDYLDTDKIVVFSKPEILIYQEYDRWPESLSTHLTRLVGSGFKSCCPNLWIETPPWSPKAGEDAVLNIKVKKMAFYAFLNQVMIDVDWILLAKGEVRVVGSESVTLECMPFSI
jgi:uncharacterized lipoprotein YmbA